jgi:hypothetical protein
LAAALDPDHLSVPSRPGPSDQWRTATGQARNSCDVVFVLELIELLERPFCLLNTDPQFEILDRQYRLRYPTPPC